MLILRDWLADEWFLTASHGNRIKGPEDTGTEVKLLVKAKGILLFSSSYSSKPVEPESHKCEQKIYHCFISTFKVWAVNTDNTAYLSVFYKITF